MVDMIEIPFKIAKERIVGARMPGMSLFQSDLQDAG